MNTSEARTWWIDRLGMHADPSGSWTMGPAQRRTVGNRPGEARELVLRSHGSDLTASWFRPDDALLDALVIVPFYDTAPVFGLPSPRTDLSGRDPAASAVGVGLATAGLSVLAVPWWFEQIAAADPATAAHTDLHDRYRPAAALHHQRWEMTALGRSIADLHLAVSAIRHEGLVGSGKLAVFGHSLGGKLAGHLAALDARIDAAVIHEAGWGFANSNWEAPWYVGEPLPGDRDHDELLSLIAPRPLLIAAGGDGDGAHNRALIDRARAHWPDEGPDLLHHNGGHPLPPHVLAACCAWLRARVA